MDNGHRRMNFYHKKSSRMGRSSSMERPGKYSSSLASAELVEGDYKLTDDILYENKMKYKFEDDSHDTILLNKYSTNNNIDNYIISSKNLLDVLEKSKNYFSKREDIDENIINQKNMIENKKKIISEIQYLNDEYKKEKNKYKELKEKINQKKLRENMYPNLTNNSDIPPEELKKNKEYISYLEDSIGKLEKENKELYIMLNTKKQETENYNTNNYEEEKYYKEFIKQEINRLKELLKDFNIQTHNQFYLYNDFENNNTKESEQNKDKLEKNFPIYENNNLMNTGGSHNFEEKNSNNSINKYIHQKNNLFQKNEILNKNNNNNNLNGNQKANIERNPNFILNENNANPTSHSGANNNQKIKSKLNYGYLNNKNSSYKSQRAGSKKKK